jgi:hypothetical protein
MLKDELFLIIGLEYDRVFIETLDPTRQLNPAHEINSEKRFFLAGVVQECLLNVLGELIHLFVLYYRSASLFGRTRHAPIGTVAAFLDPIGS